VTLTVNSFNTNFKMAVVNTDPAQTGTQSSVITVPIGIDVLGINFADIKMEERIYFEITGSDYDLISRFERDELVIIDKTSRTIFSFVFSRERLHLYTGIDPETEVAEKL
jgi:hypothetical protein